ncbi:MAG: hypothetical protein QOF14_315 [Hyphomicrobiales bacterium]|jgi:hypothetical protein|nr:hypothetical protein [Hyphomicrobiales bacterium]
MANEKNQGQGGGNPGQGGGGNPGQGGGNNDLITIHIDKKQHKLASPTTGAALYQLGEVAAGYDLWREDRGKNPNDELIANDANPVVLKNGDHFYTAQSSLNPGAAHG